MSATLEELPTRQLPARPRMTLRPRVREALWGVVFISPWLVGLVVFLAGPMIASFVMSLTDFNLVHPETTKFVGLDNYIRLTTDPTIGQALVATLKFALLAIPVTMGASLAFALLLNHPRLPAKGPLRALVYMPIMIPLVASTLVWIG
ncbi:MAG TPA: sugar ABC transporter permease, partial [Candidatus Limnocylindrales bacterium]|nr:sugar ABC transporter permease [Candidatus Limnocylindrales bacterium]